MAAIVHERHLERGGAERLAQRAAQDLRDGGAIAEPRMTGRGERREAAPSRVRVDGHRPQLVGATRFACGRAPPARRRARGASCRGDALDQRLEPLRQHGLADRIVDDRHGVVLHRHRVAQASEEPVEDRRSEFCGRDAGPDHAHPAVHALVRCFTREELLPDAGARAQLARSSRPPPSRQARIRSTTGATAERSIPSAKHGAAGARRSSTSRRARAAPGRGPRSSSAAACPRPRASGGTAGTRSWRRGLHRRQPQPAAMQDRRRGAHGARTSLASRSPRWTRVQSSC